MSSVSTKYFDRKDYKVRKDYGVRRVRTKSYLEVDEPGAPQV